MPRLPVDPSNEKIPKNTTHVNWGTMVHSEIDPSTGLITKRYWFEGYFPNAADMEKAQFLDYNWRIVRGVNEATGTPGPWRVTWVGPPEFKPTGWTPTVELRAGWSESEGSGPPVPALLMPSQVGMYGQPHSRLQPYKYRWETYTTNTMTTPDHGPSVTGSGYEWSDEPPEDRFDYSLRKGADPPVTVDDTVEDSANLARRAKGSTVFNPPPINMLSPERYAPHNIEDGDDRQPFGQVLTPDEQARRLVTVTQPLYLAAKEAEGQTEGGRLQYTTPWGFRALFNPTAWGYSGQVFEGATISQMSMAKGDLLVPGTFSYQIDLMINRSLDMAVLTAEVGEKMHDPKTAAQINWSGLAQQHYPAGTWTGGAWLDRFSGKTKAKTGSSHSHMHPLMEIYRRGTEYDIDFLYRVINGDPVNKVPGIINRWTSQRGILSPQRVRVTIGGADAFEGQITNINVNHVVMNKMMVPMVSFLSLSVQRWPNYLAGNATDKLVSKDAAP